MVKKWNCKGNYESGYICDDLCEKIKMEECKKMTEENSASKVQEANENITEISKAKERKSRKPKESEISMVNDLNGSSKLVFDILLDKKLPVESLQIYHKFLKALQAYDWNFEQKKIYLRFNRAQDDKGFLSLFPIRNVFGVPWMKTSKMKEIFEPEGFEIIEKQFAYINFDLDTAEKFANVLIKTYELQLKQEQEVIEVPFVENITEQKELEDPKEEIKEKVEETKPKEQQTSDKPENKNTAELLIISKVLITAIKNDELKLDDFDDAVKIEDYLREKDVDIPDFLDIPSFSALMREKLSAKMKKETT